jgi:23S rRNA pseudouridine1911/1915/1917 synthase
MPQDSEQNSEARVREYVAGVDNARLDRFLSEREKSMTRSRIHSLVSEGWVSVNGRPGRPAQRVKAGDRVVLTIPPVREYDVSPQDIPVNVVYQDSEIVVVDKPAGLSVHPGPGHPDGTLVNALLALCPDIQGIGGVHRPGIVHRLDKDTSGLMMVAKTERAHHGLSAQIKERQVHKGYLALTVGIPPQDEGTIDVPIARDPRHRQRMAVVLDGRESRTRYRVVEELGSHALLELALETGRTHQIRVHLAYLGYPICGDEVYGRRNPDLARHFLHANVLGFRHPVSGEPLTFRSELPDELKRVLDLIPQGNSIHRV